MRLMPVAVVGIAIVIFGASVVARSAHERIELGKAAEYILAHPPGNWLGVLLLALPGIAAELICVEIGVLGRVRLATTVLLLLFTGLMALYYDGFISSYHALANEQWTASTLAIGLLPVKGAILLFPALVLAAYLRRRKRRRNVFD